MFLNKGRRECGSPKLPKCVFLALKTTFSAQKRQKNSPIFFLTRVSKNSILQYQNSILFKKVKTFNISLFDRYDNQCSQPCQWGQLWSGSKLGIKSFNWLYLCPSYYIGRNDDFAQKIWFYSKQYLAIEPGKFG